MAQNSVHNFGNRPRGRNHLDRGRIHFDRGRNEFDRGQNEFDRGQTEFDRGLNDFDRGLLPHQPIIRLLTKTLYIYICKDHAPY